jgi:hypothetical protein
LALALVATAGCRSATEQPGPGALLLDVHLAPGAQTPDELRLSAYDDTGPLWQGARFPASGALAPRSATDLGTILLQPGATVGALRIDLRGLLGGVLVDEATLSIPSASISGGTSDVTLSTSLALDGDGDGVPDPIDDCPGVADPAQTGCPVDAGRDAKAEGHDAGRDAAVVRDAGRDTSRPRDAGSPHDAGRDVPPAKANGVSCTGVGECASGFCKDGVCCNNACNQACNSCAPSGTCTAVKSAEDDPECVAPMTCNAKGKCVAGGS